MSDLFTVLLKTKSEIPRFFGHMKDCMLQVEVSVGQNNCILDMYSVVGQKLTFNMEIAKKSIKFSTM